MRPVASAALVAAAIAVAGKFAASAADAAGGMPSWQLSSKYFADATQLDSSNLAWRVKQPVVAAQTSEDYCTPINHNCANSRCCSGLVCEPAVWDGTFQPLCGVPDASQVDPSVCYEDDHICYFSYQCCSGHCIDEDGDTIFTCESNNPSTEGPSDRGRGPGEGEQDSESRSVHYGEVNDHIPGVAVGLVVVVFVGLLVLAGLKFARQSGNHWDEPVDKIPSEAWSGSRNNYIGWSFDSADLGDDDCDGSVEVVTVGGYQIVPGDDTEKPLVPDRDYDGDAGDDFMEVSTATPPRPDVDYH